MCRKSLTSATVWLNCLFRLIKDLIKAPHYWSFVKGIHQSPVDSLHKGQVMCGAFPRHDFLIYLVSVKTRLVKKITRQLSCLSFISCLRTDSRLAPSQWETLLQSSAVFHLRGANLESALCLINTFRLRQNGCHSPMNFYMKIVIFVLKFHWNLFPRLQWTISHHWSR